MGKRYLWVCVLSVFLCVAWSVNSWATIMFTDRVEWEMAVSDIGYQGWFGYDNYEYNITNIDFEEVGKSIYDGFTYQIDAGDVSFTSYRPIFVTEPAWYDQSYDSGKGLYPFFNDTMIQVNLPNNTFAFGFDLVEFALDGDWVNYPPTPQMNSIVLSNGTSYGVLEGVPSPDISFFGFISPFSPITGVFMNASSRTEPFYDNFSYAQAFKPAPVPEPGTLLLLGSGLAGLALYRRRMNKP